MLRLLAPLAGTLVLCSSPAVAQVVTIDTSASGRRQPIDGFGTCLAGTEGQAQWFQDLYYDELGCSLLRFDLTPEFVAPYSDHHYSSPWYSNDPPFPGPEGNNVRTYSDAASYLKAWGGQSPKIAVMGPDIDKNVKLFRFDTEKAKTAGVMAQLGEKRKAQLGDFKLFASLWSPPPWLKLSSGNTIGGQSGNYPKNGTPWPFIWGGNFSGGVLDTSGTPRAEFNDGTGPTSALTQYARSLAAYLRGFQNTYGVKLYAVSLQNEINFEEFYNSCRYPLSSDYIAILKVARAELDKYPDLKPIRIEGPEDLLGGDGWTLWQLGGGTKLTHKNLQYLEKVAADPEAAKALDFFSVHGYALDGASAAGAVPEQWMRFAKGWTTAPAQGLPSTVKGFTAYGKRSWMTETSGESSAWLAPASGFPSDGAFSIAVKIHQALTAGQQSAWIYWQLSDGKPVAAQTLTDATARATSPKLVAAKHFFRHIRPGAVAVATSVAGATTLYASAYLHEQAGTLTVVLVNAASSALTASVELPPIPAGIASVEASTSAKDSYDKASTLAPSAGKLSVPVPGYGVVTLRAQGKVAPAPDAGARSDGDAAGDSTVPAGDAATRDRGAGEGGGARPAEGCGCEAGGAAPGPGLLALLLVAALVALRRARGGAAR